MGYEGGIGIWEWGNVIIVGIGEKGRVDLLVEDLGFNVMVWGWFCLELFCLSLEIG